MNATTIGNNTVQQNDINWSKRILGKLALAHIKVKIIKLDFIPNIILEDKPHKKLLRLVIIIRSATEWESISDLNGIISFRYPPKNNILVKIQITTILAYSAKKKKTNITAECSVINPLTNSDSASARSKGALFVSAIQAIKNTIKIGNRGNKNHTAFWYSTIDVKFKLPVNKITINTAELKINS